PSFSQDERHVIINSYVSNCRLLYSSLVHNNEDLFCLLHSNVSLLSRAANPSQQQDHILSLHSLSSPQFVPSLHSLVSGCRTRLLSYLTPSQTDQLSIHTRPLRHHLFEGQPYSNQQITQLIGECFYYVRSSYFPMLNLLDQWLNLRITL